MTENSEQYKKIVLETAQKMVAFIDEEATIEIKDEPNMAETLLVSINTPQNAKFLIGKNGENLKALEYLIKTLVMRQNQGSAGPLIVDVNDYRKLRASYVIDLAKQAVGRVRNSQKAEALLPMSSYERKVIHTELASCPDISTESIGEGAYRRVVIKPYP